MNPNARLLKVKLKAASVNDVGSMSMMSCCQYLPNSFFVSVLNSNIVFDYYREFINCTVNIQINDLRQVPIIIPTSAQLNRIENLFQKIYDYKKDVFNKIDSKIILPEEKELDIAINRLYLIDI